MRVMTRDYFPVRCRDGRTRSFLTPAWVRSRNPAAPERMYECGHCGTDIVLKRRGDLARHRCPEDIELEMAATWVREGKSAAFAALVGAYADAIYAQLGERPLHPRRVDSAPPYRGITDDTAGQYVADVYAVVREREGA